MIVEDISSDIEREYHAKRLGFYDEPIEWAYFGVQNTSPHWTCVIETLDVEVLAMTNY